MEGGAFAASIRVFGGGDTILLKAQKVDMLHGKTLSNPVLGLRPSLLFAPVAGQSGQVHVRPATKHSV